jgi:hypothetical protein
LTLLLRSGLCAGDDGGAGDEREAEGRNAKCLHDSYPYE